MEKEVNKSHKLLDKTISLSILFIIGSLWGFIHEYLYNLIMGIETVNKGLLYGPFIPVYGAGLVAFYLVYSKIKLKDKTKLQEIMIIFIIGFLMGGVTEYLCSYYQEKIFGTISWNYQDYVLNLHGRTSLFHASVWGILSVLFYEYMLPILNKLKKYLLNKKIQIIAVVLSVFMLLDCSISFLACYRQNERRNNIPTKNQLDTILDKYYPDEYITNVYVNAHIIKK